ncbi:MAG: AEC family transporter, partial [Parasporobacterium sp.]|nr:AEC family transporter [Parasporobacterium sp.]
MTIVNAMAKIIIAMALGFFLYKIGIFNKETNSKLSRLVVDITSPCLIFSSIVTMDSSRKGDVWSLLIAGFAIYAFLGLLAFIMVRIMRIKKNDDGVYQAMIIFGNVGFLGLPL